MLNKYRILREDKNGFTNYYPQVRVWLFFWKETSIDDWWGYSDCGKAMAKIVDHNRRSVKPKQTIINIPNDSEVLK